MSKTNYTLDYYNNNAQKFIEGTVSVEFGSMQNRFLDKLEKGASILDFGCGSGRDAKYFLEQGYEVTAVDGSKELCKSASDYAGITVKCMLFQELDEKDMYDGIWACSSILHVPTSELKSVILKMSEALKKNGIIYTSFKYGTFEGERNGRYFTDMTEETFALLIRDIRELEIEELWITSDVRPGRGEEKMAQFDFTEKVNNFEIEPTDVMTGDKNQSRYLYYQLKMSMEKARQIDIIVSFLMESGVRMLLKDLKRALNRGVKIRILTGNYLGITQPSALYLIKKELGNRVDLRFYNEKERSFHPKSYIFHYEYSNEIYIGSSNISRSALTFGIEWNYRFSDAQDKKNYQLFYATFEDLFLNHSIVIDEEELKRYSKTWKKPAVSKDLAKYDLAENADDKVRMLFQPRGAQIEALYALEESRLEGATKGLVHAATGIGKTYLAAFDSAKYKRVLFVAHREEILKQAATSFKNVRNSGDYGFFYGKQKDTDKPVIFASVATLGRAEYLDEKYFEKDYFDYIVIDDYAIIGLTQESPKIKAFAA